MVIFLYGDDSFRSRRKLNEIKEKYLISDKSGSGLSSFDALEEKNIFEKFKNAVNTSNLFSSKRLVILEDVISSGLEAEQKKMEEFLKKNISKIQEAADVVLVFWESTPPKKTNALFKILISEYAGKSQNFEKYQGAKLDQWIIRRLYDLDKEVRISKTALELLVVYCGNDTMVLEQELQKLVNHSDGQMISDQDVKELVHAGIDTNIFKTIDSLGANNKSEALRLLHDHLKKGDDPFYLFSMFVYQFRNLLKVSDLRDNKNAGEREIANITKMHPFVVKKSLGQISKFDFQKLKNIYLTLIDIDAKVKKGKIDIKLALDKFVAEI